MRPRLIASDLDGTLFGADSVPEPRTVAAVNAIVDAGCIFVAVTGRSYFGGAARVTDAGARMHWFIGSNGGHRLNLTSGELEERLLFSTDDIHAIQDNMTAELPGIGFGYEHDAGFSYDEGFRTAFPNAFDGGPRRDTAAWAADNIGKIFVTHPELDSDDLVNATSALAPSGTEVTTSGIAFAEFTPAGATKALGLERLCDQLGIAASEVVAFGDNNNDISMLQWAGRSIAMANATPAALAAADEVTAPNTDFGVAHILEALAL